MSQLFLAIRAYNDTICINKHGKAIDGNSWTASYPGAPLFL